MILNFCCKSEDPDSCCTMIVTVPDCHCSCRVHCLLTVRVSSLKQERIRMLELLVSSQCPQQAASLSPPHVDIIGAYLRACFQVCC